MPATVVTAGDAGDADWPNAGTVDEMDASSTTKGSAPTRERTTLNCFTYVPEGF
jgi:hypothetical protein